MSHIVCRGLRLAANVSSLVRAQHDKNGKFLHTLCTAKQVRQDNKANQGCFTFRAKLRLWSYCTHKRLKNKKNPFTTKFTKFVKRLYYCLSLCPRCALWLFIL